SAAPASEFGRGDRTRTYNPRFWRPVLYQLSYTPKFLILFRFRSFRCLSHCAFQPPITCPISAPNLALTSGNTKITGRNGSPDRHRGVYTPPWPVDQGDLNT